MATDHTQSGGDTLATDVNSGGALAAIERNLADGSYRVGEWQRWLAAIEQDPTFNLSASAEQVDRVSNQLHRRNGFREFSFDTVWCGQWLLAIAGLTVMVTGSVTGVVIGTGLLALAAQPLIKSSVGLLLGVRYAYAYLWYVEPRFKMRYSTYLGLSSNARIGLHLAGSLGTPAALLAGCLCADSAGSTLWTVVIGLAFAGATALQVGAFVAESLDVRHVAGFRLANLTSPATAARELRKARQTSR